MNLTDKQKDYAKKASMLILATSIAACGSGGGGGGGSSSNETETETETEVETSPAASGNITGFVTAPSGDIAFNKQPESLQQQFASAIFGNKAHAGVSGVSSVGAGVTVDLIEVDADGIQVGAVVETTTTDSTGKYGLQSVIVANSKYIIRVTGTTESMDVRYTGATNDVNPTSDAVSDVITDTTNDLAKISTDEVNEIADAVQGVIENFDPTGKNATQLGLLIKAEIVDNEALSNQISSTAQTESICGNVQDSSFANLSGIRIIVKDFGNWVTRAKTKTDADGNYCVNVPASATEGYIIGAFNFGITSTAASEWWSTTGDKYSPIDATKVTVAATAEETRNFVLEPGARLEGSVTAATASSLVQGAAIKGSKVTIRQYFNYFPLSSKRVRDNGTYTLNVIPGEYRVEAKNQSRFDYASEIYDGADGTSATYDGAKVTLVEGDIRNIDFALDKGYKVSGTILDNSVSGNPVTGLRVKVNNTGGSGASFRLRTNNKGKYRVWLKPAIYNVESYGSNQNVDLSSSSQPYNIATQVGAVKLVIEDSSDNSPISQAKVFMTDVLGNKITNEVSSSDGTVTLYSPVGAIDNKIYLRVDGSQTYASIVYDGATRVRSGTNISVTQGDLNPTPITVGLPAAGTLRVIVTDGTDFISNYSVQILSGGTSGADKFISGRTLSNGEYEVSVPAVTYDAVRLSVNCPSISVIAGQVTILNFNTSTNTCS